MTESSSTNAPGSERTDPPTSPIAKILAAIVVLVILAAGATVWTLSSGGREAKETARIFIDLMLAGKFNEAKSHCTPDVDFERMQRDVKKMEDWGRLRDVTLTARHAPRTGSPDRYDVAGDLEFTSELKKNFTGTLLKQPDGTYRVSFYTFD